MIRNVWFKVSGKIKKRRDGLFPRDRADAEVAFFDSPQ